MVNALQPEHPPLTIHLPIAEWRARIEGYALYSSLASFAAAGKSAAKKRVAKWALLFGCSGRRERVIQETTSYS